MLLEKLRFKKTGLDFPLKKMWCQFRFSMLLCSTVGFFCPCCKIAESFG